MIARDRARLAVVVPTFRRPESLVATLDSLAAQRIAEPFAIVVADNDADGRAGVDAAQAWAKARGLEAGVVALAVADRGISQNRNAGLAAAFGLSPDIEAAAMIDDDATADPDWLARLAEARRRFDADIVCGPQLFDFPPGAPEWAMQSTTFHVVDRPTGLVSTNRSMCNAAISRRLHAGWGIHGLFDPAFGRSGGEDIDLFERCAGAGRPMAWCAEAVVREFVPEERLNRAWLLRRAWSAGHIMARIDRKRRGARAVPAQLALASRTILSGLARRAAGPSAATRFDGAARVRVGLGRLAGLLQPPSVEY